MGETTRNVTPEDLLLASGRFEVAEVGIVFRVRDGRGRPCLPRRAENRTSLGYLQVRAVVAGKRIHVGAHRMVWTAHFGPIPEGQVINHLDGQKDNNRPENLELTTYSGNNTHARRVLKVVDQVAEIRRRRAAGERLKSIATDFGVSDRNVSRIALGHRWVREFPEASR